MNCHSSSRLYLRANGTVPCNCDTGETTTLFAPKIEDLDSFDYVADCFNGEPFLAMRNALLEGRAPIKACESCFFFHPSEEFEKYGASGVLSHIEHIQVESSFHCGVDCEACVLRSTRTVPALSALGEGPYDLPLPVFRKLVDDICRAGLTVGELAFCGRGEPLLNTDFSAMVAYVRERLPDTFISVVTSGNAPYHAGLLDVDHVAVSIDGGYPDSYEIYRKGGKLKRTLDFLRSVVAHRGEAGSKPKLCWRYILFEHNDSEQELEHAQNLAREIGVDEMLFVLTHTWNRSTKYTTAEQIAELPEFKVFDGERITFSNVNKETDNLTHWDELGELPRERRFEAPEARAAPRAPGSTE